MTMRFVFRADAGRIMGYGHVYRCLALADALAALGHVSTFVTRNHEGHVATTIEARGHEAVLLPLRDAAALNPSSWLGDQPGRDAEDVLNVAADRHAHGVIADHYAIDRSWTLAVRASGLQVVVVDDLADRQLTCQVLVNHNLQSERLPYREVVGEDTSLLLGPRYALLAPEFAEARALRARRSATQQGGNRVFVGLGGSDTRNVTTHVLQSLLPLRERSVQLDIVIGRAHPSPELVRKYASAFADGHVHMHVSPREVALLLAHADVAIGAGGSSALERLCVGVPSVVVEVASNQRSTVAALTEAQLAFPYRLGRDSKHDLPDLVTELLDNDSLRGDMQHRGWQCVDGHGAQRVAAALIDGPNAVSASDSS